MAVYEASPGGTVPSRVGRLEQTLVTFSDRVCAVEEQLGGTGGGLVDRISAAEIGLHGPDYGVGKRGLPLEGRLNTLEQALVLS